MTVIRLFAGALLVTAVACHHRNPGAGATPNGGAPATADTARGRLEIVGSEPATLLTLAPMSAAGETFVLRGADALRLRTAQGLEITVFGRFSGYVEGLLPRPARSVTVERFVVRAVNGIPAHDGIIARDGERYVLVTADGARLPAPFLPTALHARVGTRVYLAGPLTAAPVAYGIIGPA